MIPLSSHAAVFISVGFAPPVLPVYVQPPCPEPGWMWTPGYWGYGPDGYYWVPGTWVPAPYVGALWTPGYWGWGSGLYVWHPGYWGRHVGYYGGVNYGFGYMGIGFAGGVWAGKAFRYNTAVMRVGGGIHNTYIDRTVVERNTIVNNRRVAFSGGPGGINHSADTRGKPVLARAAHVCHVVPGAAPDSGDAGPLVLLQQQPGNPSHAAMDRPMGFSAHGSASGGINNSRPNNGSFAEHSNARGNFSAQPANRGGNMGGQQHAQPQMHESRPAPQMHESRPAPQMHESRPAPQMHESRPAPQAYESHGGGGGQDHGHDKGR